MRLRLFRLSLTFTGCFYLLLTLPSAALLIQSRYYRFQTLEQLSHKWSYIQHPRYVFCGDSITSGGENWAIRFGEFPMRSINLAGSGYTISQVAAQIPRAALYTPSWVSVMAGSNDVLTARSDDQILQDFEKMIQLLNEQNLKNVVFTSIPVTSDPKNDVHIIEINASIKTLVTHYHHLFLDINSIIINTRERRALFLADGIHFSEMGYQMWATKLKQTFLEAKRL